MPKKRIHHAREYLHVWIILTLVKSPVHIVALKKLKPYPLISVSLHTPATAAKPSCFQKMVIAVYTVPTELINVHQNSN